jgi:haloalkane dehalogenase
MTTIQAISQKAQTNKSISADFPYESHFQKVLGSDIHYVDEGDPKAKHTFLLLHGNPTSSYLWRNIIPHLSDHGRVIAPDLIGMGKSGKPDIDYTFQDHIKYMDEFIAQMNLKQVILVIQDWGSGIGFHYAYRNQDKVAGIVFFEQ